MTERHHRPQLLPRLGVLAAINALAILLSAIPYGAVAIAALSIVYLAVVILRTLDLVNRPSRMHWADQWMCRHGGPLAAVLAWTLMMGVVLMDTLGMAPEDLGLESSWGVLGVGFVMEVGVVLTVACLGAPRSLRHVPVVPLWKTICLPLLIIYGSYVVLLPWSL